MVFLKYVLYAAGSGLLFLAAAIVLFDLLQWWARREESLGVAARPLSPTEVRWWRAAKLAVAGFLPVLIASSIVVIPSGFAGVRVSQFSGTRPGTLYPGVHFVKPLLGSVAVYDTRERIFATGGEVVRERKKADATVQPGLLQVQSKEGLRVGLGISVRFALDARRLDHIHAALPQPIEVEIVPPVVANAFRQLTPGYSVREVFATRREEIRQKATEAITSRLAADGILVKEVMLRDIVLPAEFAKGLEALLMKEQENDRLNLEIEIKQKEVRTSELAAEAGKRTQIKAAEAQAEVKVLQAKAEADAMKFTLPLKEKQIEQSRLEAQARKEATLQNAQAAADAKVIDSKAELERRKLLAEAEANRIRLTAAADAERMKLEALVLKQNPLLIQKIIAERLSDKLQIMMVPGDGKNFFVNDVLRSALSTVSDEPKENGAVRPPQ
jgi:regulator of protease activity HflC (stomatin/prohibitin superfamily)